ncbi:ABC transporter substrate-binding protein [Sphingoaurantiacus capsulatus]|uniref:ABC transporter substrate-binding protein n=1 Tax=Sphingoaurantiacus capsulatus TaxID=1771310 RepID=A0ABV7XH43_9SPHN
MRAVVLALVLAGCSAPEGGGDADTFSISLTADAGNLDPQHAATFAPAFLAGLAYEGLVAKTEDGRLVPGLAESWTQTPTSVTYKLRDGLTCASGEALTIDDVAANYRYVADPKNQSPLLGGGGIPIGTKIEVDRAARTLKLTTAAPYSFLVHMTGGLTIVCPRGLKDRSRLVHGTEGTGLFALTEAVANSHYVFTRRSGYRWGADGTTSETPGVPKRLVVRIIPNQTTAANLLLAGDLTAAPILGPDRRRLETAGFRAIGSRAPAFHMWFNQKPGHATADLNVRKALSLAIDVPQLAKVATGGMGLKPRRLSGSEPVACPADIVGQFPPRDEAAANALLAKAGWLRGRDGIRRKNGQPLSLKLVWDRDLNDPTSSAYAAEYAISRWQALGIKVGSRSVGGAEVGQVLFGTGDYDISWVPIVVSLPSRFLGFVSGPTPPNGLNFPHTNIPEADRLAAEANTRVGDASCPTWDRAERQYLDTAAVVPIADTDNALMTRRATFAKAGLMIIPTSIRMIAE